MTDIPESGVWRSRADQMIEDAEKAALRKRAERADLPGHGHEHTIDLFTRVKIMQLQRQVDEMRKRVAQDMRAKDEAIGELLEQLGYRSKDEDWLGFDEWLDSERGR